MSEQLKIGDRVRVVKWGGRVFNRAADLTKYNLDGQIGFIFDDDTLGCISVRLPKLDACISICCLELVKPRRTFEEIVKELAEKLPLWNLQEIGKKVAHFNTVNNANFVIWRDGSFGVDGFFTPDQLTDIAAACSEIAAIRKEGGR